MENYLLISDAAKEVGVESHALRYWEGELKMPVKRNEKGHRYYTQEDVEQFKLIKNMKEKGLQLKAIRGVLEKGEAEVPPLQKEQMAEKEKSTESTDTVEEDDKSSGITMGIEILSGHEDSEKMQMNVEENTRARSERLQWLLRQLVKEVLKENNQELCRDIKECVVKELDYQFRTQEERNDERERKRLVMDEAYYQRMDELLRKKSRRKDWFKKEKI